jgi:hypothetical protein
MVIDNLDISGAVRRPDKADAPLPVDPHGVLPSPITFQFFQVVARRKPQILYSNRCIQRRKHRPGALDQVTWEAFAIFSFHGIGSEFAFGTLDHTGMYHLGIHASRCDTICGTVLVITSMLRAAELDLTSKLVLMLRNLNQDSMS